MSISSKVGVSKNINVGIGLGPSMIVNGEQVNLGAFFCRVYAYLTSFAFAI